MRKPLILVVEDDPILRDLTRRQIIKLGFESVVLADSAEAALEQDVVDVGLIFMDIGLPGIDGVHATMILRERELREQRKRTPIIALTGHADPQQVLSVGMDDYLQKPALIKDIKSMIDKWLIH